MLLHFRPVITRRFGFEGEIESDGPLGINLFRVNRSVPSSDQPDSQGATIDSTDVTSFETRRRLAFSLTLARIVALISLFWVGLGLFLEVPICTAAAAIVTAGSVTGLVLHALRRYTLSRCIWLVSSNIGVFLGANLVDPIGRMDSILVACVGVPFVIFSWRSERGMMLALVALPIVLWGITWGADFNLFEYHEVGPELAGRYIDVAAALTVFGLVAMELGYFAIVTAKSEENLKNALDAAERANLAKSEFLSTMSHELRTPMNAILGFAQVLEFNPKEPLTEDQKSCVGHIMNGGRHLLELIDQVLDLAKIEAQKMTLSLEGIQLDGICQDCLSLIDKQAKDRGLTVAGDLGTNNFIKADYVRFKQVLLNLLSNAVKYNREGGAISLTCTVVPGDMIRVAVSDTGEGIAEDDWAGLFEPFNRLGHGTGTIEGTGIGLSISKRLIEAMGGKIGMESEVGKGSTFWVEVPATESIEVNESITAKIQKKESSLEGPLSTDATILYVEDNPANLLLMKKIVDGISGLTLISASDANLGLAMAEDQQPDLILMDINLPGMDGIAAKKVLDTMECTKDIPVVAVSAAAMKSDIDKGMAAGFSGYLTKPFDVPAVVAAIKKELDA